MIVLDHAQGTEEWLQARLGVPSASQFGKLVTATGKPSASAEGYINQLIAERMIGERGEIYTNSHMERGTMMEPEARSYYEFVVGRKVQEVGFCLHDTIRAGCSPDGLVGDYGLEIKCPSAPVQVSYLREGKLPVQYKQQVMGCMWITGADGWDFLAYHPDMPSLLITVERDQNYIDLLALEVEKAADEIEKQTQRLLKMRSKP